MLAATLLRHTATTTPGSRSKYMFRALSSGILAGCIIASTLAINNGSASAATGNGTCDPGEVCVWQDSGFHGCMRDWIPTGGDTNWVNASPLWNYGAFCVGRNMNDKVTSVWNRSGVRVTFFQNSNPHAFTNAFCAQANSSTANLQNFNVAGVWNPNDSFSAHTTGGPGPALKCTRTDSD